MTVNSVIIGISPQFIMEKQIMFVNHNSAPYKSITAIACALMVMSCLSWGDTGDIPQWVAPFAENVYEAFQHGMPMPQISVAHSDASQKDAYLVQREFVRRLMESEKIGGYKAAGVANPAPDHPLVAVMPASGILFATDTILIDLAEDPNRHVETEVGYVFGKTITKPLADVTALQQGVKAIVAIVEVPGGAVEAKQPGTENDIIAWNINAKAMIVGAAHSPDEIDPDSVMITLKHDGETVNTAKGDMAASGQWNTLLKTVNHVLTQGYAIQPGHIITNGALGKILKAVPGKYHTNFGALGRIEFVVR